MLNGSKTSLISLNQSGFSIIHNVRTAPLSLQMSFFLIISDCFHKGRHHTVSFLLQLVEGPQFEWKIYFVAGVVKNPNPYSFWLNMFLHLNMFKSQCDFFRRKTMEFLKISMFLRWGSQFSLTWDKDKTENPIPWNKSPFVSVNCKHKIKFQK